MFVFNIIFFLREEHELHEPLKMINICGIGSLENRNAGLWDSDSDSEAWITKKFNSLKFPFFSTTLQFFKLSVFSLEKNC
jgi:hypothetical protein